MEESKKRIVIFASGAGSNARRIIEYFKGSATEVALIVCNKPGAGVTQVAREAGVPLLLIGRERFFSGDAYLPELRAVAPSLLVLAGFLWKVPQPLIEAFPRQIVNIHPALLPKFGGQGMYGQYVHEAVLQAGEMESGITVHYVDGHYDQGDIIFQTGCPVMDKDGPAQLAARIHELEHIYYPQVIEGLLARS